MRPRGFSLLELLVVLALLGLLLGFLWPFFRQVQARWAVEGAALELARGLQEARAQAKRDGETTCVRVFQEGYAVGRDCEVLSEPTRLFQGAQVVATNHQAGLPLDIPFFPPYGTTDAPLRSLTLAHVRDSGLTRTVHVAGVIGKVVVQ